MDRRSTDKLDMLTRKTLDGTQIIHKLSVFVPSEKAPAVAATAAMLWKARFLAAAFFRPECWAACGE